MCFPCEQTGFTLEGLENTCDKMLVVERCEKLASLQGGPSTLEEVHASRTGIASLKGLETTNVKKLFVRGCEKLASLQGCPSTLVELDASDASDFTMPGEFGFRDMKTYTTRIASLKGLESTIAKKVNVENCKKLTSLQGCPSTIKELKASGTGITSLEGSTSSKKLVVERCEKLASLRGCPSTLQELLASHTGITSLEGLGNTNCKKLVVEKCEKLASLQGCPGTLEDLQASDTGITSLEGLRNTCVKILVVGAKNLPFPEGTVLAKGDAVVVGKRTGVVRRRVYDKFGKSWSYHVDFDDDDHDQKRMPPV